MSQEQIFGTRLKALRLQQHLSQRELAKRVAARLKEQDGRGFDFTYLSKIENAWMVPSEAAIRVLAEILSADSADFIYLAGKVPTDLGEKLQKQTHDKNARLFYRSVVDRELSSEQWDELIAKLRKITGE